MAGTKELFERLANDQAFAEQFTAAVSARREAGAASYYETVIPVAAEFGYEVKPEELDKINEQQAEVLTDDELGKVAGGTSCLTVIATISAVTSVCATVASIIDTIIISIEEIT